MKLHKDFLRNFVPLWSWRFNRKIEVPLGRQKTEAPFSIETFFPNDIVEALSQIGALS